MNHKITVLPTSEVVLEVMPGPGITRRRKEINELLEASVNSKRIAGYNTVWLKSGIIRIAYNSLVDKEGKAAQYVAEEIVALCD